MSVVGVGRVPHGCYAGRALQEELVARGEMPWTVLRAKPSHEFAQPTGHRGVQTFTQWITAP